MWNLIFTFVWQLEDLADAREVERLVDPLGSAGGNVAIVELYTDLETRSARNRGADRIAAKPTKHDVTWSDANVRELERYRLNTDPTDEHLTPADQFLSCHPHPRLSTADQSTTQTAETCSRGWNREHLVARTDASCRSGLGSVVVVDGVGGWAWVRGLWVLWSVTRK